MFEIYEYIAACLIKQMSLFYSYFINSISVSVNIHFGCNKESPFAIYDNICLDL